MRGEVSRCEGKGGEREGGKGGGEEQYILISQSM